ncbi:MAG: nucleotidyltransferase [Planctomycetes bacterium]|nr:nucleotidyltransferase [Planctomycetota bacterium]
MDLLETDPVTGKRTGLARTVRKALRAMRASCVPFSVIGATALAVRGLPRMSRDLDLVVLVDDADVAIDALRDAGLRASTPTYDDEGATELIFVDPATGVEVDLLVAAGDPEATVIGEAQPTAVFGAAAPVASLEHLLLLYLYSNQPRHLGDFASIAQSGRADLKKAERSLALMHPEMLTTYRRRVKEARTPPAAAPRPPARRSTPTRRRKG